MKTMKSKIVTGIVTTALAIAPFTGTGIDAVDKNLTKSTAITANADYSDFRPGLYLVRKSFTGRTYSGNVPVQFYAGTYISVDSNCMCRGVKMTWYMHTHCGTGADSEECMPHIVFIRG